MLFYIIVGALLLYILLVICAAYSHKSLTHVIKEIRYEIIYNILGAVALAEDIIQKRKNKFELVNRDGCVAIVTGGARGIGVEVVKMLADCNMTVIIACRNVKAGEDLARKIQDKNSNVQQIKTYQLDVGSLESVRKFAKQVSNDYPKINYLINNAGIMFGPYKETVDGFESQFAINYLGHFLLTHLLLPNLKRAGQDSPVASRIVNVSSCANLVGGINFDDINSRNMYISSEAYAQSKLAQVLFSSYLNQILKSEGCNIEVFSVHPGIVNTELFNGTPVKILAPWMPMLFFKTPSQGATSILYTCLSKDLEGKGGCYISNCQIGIANSLVNDTKLEKDLFQFTNKLVGIDKFSDIE